MTFFSKLNPKLPPIKDTETLDCFQLLSSLKQILPFFDLLGYGFKIVKSDISNNIDILLRGYSQDTKRFSTFNLLLEEELNRKSEKAKNSCCLSFLWLKRGLEYQLIFLSEIIHESNSGQENLGGFCNVAYEKSLKPYHGWLTKQAFSVISRTLPWKRDFFRALKMGNENIDDQQVLNDLRDYVQLLRPNVDAMQNLVKSLDIDFPDVV